MVMGKRMNHSMTAITSPAMATFLMRLSGPEHPHVTPEPQHASEVLGAVAASAVRLAAKGGEQQHELEHEDDEEPTWSTSAPVESVRRELIHVVVERKE